jgi:serine-type D-Ala-D-Ala carboxypeptidase/endopeptidase (penicillin-binding protein 4)
MTPRSIAYLLSKIWKEQPHERVLNLFPKGGSEGTIKDFYKPAAGEKAWIFAKTGTMSGVHSLSGFLIARSGKVLVFSFMHNNFVGSSQPYKVEMERILRKIREKY